MRVTSLHPLFGVEISGIAAEQLTQPALVTKIQHTVHEYGFALLRGIRLTADSAMTLASTAVHWPPQQTMIHLAEYVGAWGLPQSSL